MRLTHFSDYALRLMMYAAVRREQHKEQRKDQLVTIEETAELYGLSRAHLMKVANQLTRAGFLKATRGRNGGLSLAKKPERIRLGDVVRATEPDFALVECFESGNQCLITPRCRLRGVLHEAMGAFMGVLDGHTLADLLLSPADFGIKSAA
jgi:Rrf2 family transcriptional regulator, nitric oxide-sensitive transcriptional repressor